MKVIKSEEDQKAFKEKFGTYVDNATIKVNKENYELHITVGVFKKKDSYAVYAGQDEDICIAAEGSNYTSAIEALLKVL